MEHPSHAASANHCGSGFLMERPNIKTNARGSERPLLAEEPMILGLRGRGYDLGER